MEEFLRDVAQLKGRNPQIVEAMADKDIHIEGLSERGKLLNLTSRRLWNMASAI